MVDLRIEVVRNTIKWQAAGFLICLTVVSIVYIKLTATNDSVSERERSQQGFYLQEYPRIPSNFEVAGIKDPEELRHFLIALKKAVKADDHRAVMAMVRYPLTYHESGKKKEYSDFGELAPDFHRVFKPGAFHVVEAATFEDLFLNFQGVMLGDGEIWMGYGSDGIKITAVNDIDAH